jgi:glycine betaine/proline transport system ATP-binding protein
MDALDQVGLSGWEDTFPNQLSGGMQQRVGLARGLAVDPDILLMDEAFSALDPLIRTEMQDELLKLQEEQQRTIVFISHDLDEALRIGDRIAIMESGRVVQVGAPEDILQNPADDYVRAFFRGVDPTNVISSGDISATRIPLSLRQKLAACAQPTNCSAAVNETICTYWIQGEDFSESSLRTPFVKQWSMALRTSH